MKDNIFNVNDLILCDWQYTIRHTNTKCFKNGEKVFLKSNPDHIMIVYDITDKKIITTWKDNSGAEQYCDFTPECILQYKFASLKTFRKKHSVCLN